VGKTQKIKEKERSGKDFTKTKGKRNESIVGAHCPPRRPKS